MIACIEVDDTAMKKSSLRDIVKHTGYEGAFTYSRPPNQSKDAWNLWIHYFFQNFECVSLTASKILHIRFLGSHVPLISLPKRVVSLLERPKDSTIVKWWNYCWFSTNSIVTENLLSSFLVEFLVVGYLFNNFFKFFALFEQFEWAIIEGF